MMPDEIADRDAAWAALHDPATPASQLAAIAAAHPEFGEAIARHPNAYPALIAWAGTVGPAGAPAVVASSPTPDAATEFEPALSEPATSPRSAEAAMPSSTDTSSPAGRPRRGLVVAAVITAGVFVVGGGTAWAVASFVGSDPAGTSAVPEAPEDAPPVEPSGPRALAGPPVYIGEELDWFLWDEAQLRAFFPDAGTVTFDADLPSIGEGEGMHPDIEACFPWVMEDVYPIVGIRNAGWDNPQIGEYSGGSFQVLQLPSVEQAADYYDGFAGSIDECSEFQFLDSTETPFASFALARVAETAEGIVVDQFSNDSYSGERSVTRAFVLEGNVLLRAYAPRTQQEPVDPQELLSAMVESAKNAREQLTEKIGFR